MAETIAPPSRRQWNATVIPQRVRERAATKWESDGDCQISTYSIASHGYAQIGWQNNRDRHVVLAHRASWEFSMGPVPLEYTLDHLCKQKRCVNPAHLRILPNFENARRTSGRDWPLGQCVNGHPNSLLRSDAKGKRYCSECAATIWKSAPAGASRRRPRALTAPRVRSKPKPRAEPKIKTHCRNGHPWVAENFYTRPNGRNECLPCKRAHATVWHNSGHAQNNQQKQGPINPLVLAMVFFHLPNRQPER